MASPAHDDETDEKPLDPAVESVRRKLVRFVAINVSLLLLALMAVMGAIVYKIAEPADAPRAADAGNRVTISGDGPAEGRIALPAGATVASQALDGARLSLHVRLAGGGAAVFVYDIAEGRMIGRFDIVDEGGD